MSAPPSVVAHKPHFHRDEAWKQPVRCATTAAITIATGLNAGDAIDGVTLAAGDRVLVKDQAAGAENGIYIAGVTPARAFDMDVATEVVGALVLVVEGTVNAGTLWRATNTATPTLGTTALAFAQATAHGHAHSALSGIGADDHHARQHAATSAPDHTFPGGTTNFLRADGTFAAPPGGGSALTVADEGTPLATAATTLDFVGAGVVASGAGATKTITISGGGSGVTVEEVDGTPTVTATKLVLPNGTLGVVGSVATYTPAAGGSDLVQVASGAGSIRIPGLSGSPDMVPGSPSAYDDEFGAALGGAWAAHGTLDVSEANVVPSHYRIKRTTTGTELNGILKTSPSAPYTVTAKLADMVLVANYQQAGLWIADSTPTALFAFGPCYINGANNYNAFQWTNRTTRSTGLSGGDIGGPTFFPMYIRIVVTSSTSVTCQVSRGGLVWATIASGSPNLTPAKVGIYVGGWNGRTDEAFFDWIRVT